MAEKRARTEHTSVPDDGAWVDIARVVFPTEDIDEVLPLYVEHDQDDTLQETGLELRGRRGIFAEYGVHVSLGSYFNAFPASYWRTSTPVRTVRLRGRFTGRATVQVWQSSARGRCSILTTALCEGDFSFDIAIKGNVNGGFYWLEFTALDRDGALLEDASWQAEAALARVDGTVSIGITTFNRAPYCLRQIRTVAGDPLLRQRLDRLYVVDQGTDLVRDQPGFAAVASDLGEQLGMIRQGNLGGSGGFSRAMYETLQAGRAEYVLLLDDDAILESESVLRALALANFAVSPTIVGGAMLHLDQRSVLYVQGERVDFVNGFPVPNSIGYNTDFGHTPLRRHPHFHQRAQSDYNAWWMCLIPRSTIAEIGLGLPLFLKWDDMEFGIRAARHGVPTVSLPGAAVWHLAWHDKSQPRSWEEYFAQRNSWLGLMIMSPATSPLRFTRNTLLGDLLFVMTMQYSNAQVRILAREEAAAGMSGLHEGLGGAIRHARGLRQGFSDAEAHESLVDFPAVVPPAGGKQLLPRHDVKSPVELAVRAGRELLRSLVVPVRRGSRQNPEVFIGSPDLAWWQFADYDSALTASADSAGYTWLKRDPRLARQLLRRSLASCLELRRNWHDLAARAKGEAAQAASPQAWERTFAANAVQE